MRQQKRLRSRKNELASATPLISEAHRDIGRLHRTVLLLWRHLGFRFVVAQFRKLKRALFERLNSKWWNKTWFQFRTQHYMYTTCTLHVYYMYTTCTLHVHYMHITCTPHVHYMYTTCTLHVQYMYTTCTLHVHYMYTTSGRNIR